VTSDEAIIGHIKHQLIILRWNSTRDMLYRARELRTSLDEFLDQEQYDRSRSRRTTRSPDEVDNRIGNAIFAERLKNDDWAIINEVIDMLEPLKQFTKRMEGRPSEETANGIRDVYDSVRLILEHLETLKLQYSESGETGMAFWAAIEAAWSKANEYYTALDDTPVYTAALLFDPRGKLEYLKRDWTPHEVTTQLEKVRGMWERVYRAGAANPIHVASSTSSSQESQGRTPLGRLSNNQHNKKRKRDDVDNILKQSRKLNIPRAVGDELTLYLNSELETDDELIPLQYWLHEPVRLRYPSLSRFAIDVYACAAMSSEAERAFSVAGSVTSGKRVGLNEDTSESLLCLNH